MSNQSSMSRSLVTFACFAFLSTFAFAMAFGVSDSEAASGRGSETNHVAATSKTDTDSYVAEVKPVGTYAAGKEGFVDVVLVAKDPFHINDHYSFKFATMSPAPEGVTFPKTSLVKADGTFDAKTASFRVPFVVSKAGKFSIGGTLSLSVCSPASCLMEKVELALDVDVK